MRLLRKAGLSRIHVGLESGDDTILKRVKKRETDRGGQPGPDLGFKPFSSRFYRDAIKLLTNCNWL